MANQSASGTNILMIIAVALIAFAGGYFIGTNSSGGGADSAQAENAEVGAAARGDNALAAPTLEQLDEIAPDNPLFITPKAAIRSI